MEPQSRSFTSHWDRVFHSWKSKKKKNIEVAAETAAADQSGLDWTVWIQLRCGFSPSTSVHFFSSIFPALSKILMMICYFFPLAAPTRLAQDPWGSTSTCDCVRHKQSERISLLIILLCGRPQNSNSFGIEDEIVFLGWKEETNVKSTPRMVERNPKSGNPD